MDERSLPHPFVMFVTMLDKDESEHGSCAQAPASHELSGCTSEEFSGVVRMLASPITFRQDASLELATVSSVVWH